MSGYVKVSWAVVTLACLALSCADNDRRNPNQLHDTLGVTLAWECNDKGCDIPSAPAAFLSCGIPHGFTLDLDQIALVCSSTLFEGVTSFYPEDCRPLACTTSDECPYFDRRIYDCHNGLCETLDTPVVESPERLVALCMSTEPRPTECNKTDAVADALIAKNCDDNGCTLPSTCLQP